MFRAYTADGLLQRITGILADVPFQFILRVVRDILLQFLKDSDDDY
jgi:hypothetical protein